MNQKILPPICTNHYIEIPLFVGIGMMVEYKVQILAGDVNESERGDVMNFLKESFSELEFPPNSTVKGIPHKINRDGKNIFCVVGSTTLKIELTRHFRIVDAMEITSRLEEAEESNTEICTGDEGKTFYIEIPSEIKEIPSFYFCGEEFWVEYTKKSLLERIGMGFLTGKMSRWGKLYHFRFGSEHMVKVLNEDFTGETVEEVIRNLEARCEDKGIKLIRILRGE